MGILSWCVVGLLAGGLARRAVGTPKRGCLGTIAIGVLGALIAGAASRWATGDEIGTFDELDLGSIFVAFIGAAPSSWSWRRPPAAVTADPVPPWSIDRPVK